MTHTNEDGSPKEILLVWYDFLQLWDDSSNMGRPNFKEKGSYGGDNDPLDVMAIGSVPLKIGSITPCRVIGTFQLIDEGEMDNKSICIEVSDPEEAEIRSMDDLQLMELDLSTTQLTFFGFKALLILRHNFSAH